MVNFPEHIGWSVADRYLRNQRPDLPRIHPGSSYITFVPSEKYGTMLTVYGSGTNFPDPDVVPFFHPNQIFIEGEGESQATAVWEYLNSIGSNPLDPLDGGYGRPDWAEMPELVRTQYSNQLLERHVVMKYFDRWEDMRTELAEMKEERRELRDLMRAVNSLD